MKRLLIANRGEIAIRIARAATELGIRTVSVYSEDDAASLHVRRADDSQLLPGAGARAYLDIDAVLAAAKAADCDAIHPGYGFLSENSNFASRCAKEGLTFVGPSAEMLAMFGDKVQARALANRCSVPTLPGSGIAESLSAAVAFFNSLPKGAAVMIKAVGGGGGRGMRVVEALDDLEKAYTRCRSEAKLGFGNDAVYVEELIRRARHIEVQVIGDGTGAVSHLWERECTLQRRHQMLIEIAPSTGLPESTRSALTDAAVRMAREVGYDSLGTFEFLVDADDESRFFFIEANARLQVEHTVTEEVTGIDLVQAQLRAAAGETLSELGLEQAQVPDPRGYAIQCRVNMETMAADGNAKPSGGTLSVFEVPSGPGIRTDTFDYSGYTTSPRFDSLLAKVIVHSPSPEFKDAINRSVRALAEFRIQGVGTSLEFLQALLTHPDVAAGCATTRFVENEITSILERMPEPDPALAASACPGGGRATTRGCKAWQRRPARAARLRQDHSPCELGFCSHAIRSFACDYRQRPGRNPPRERTGSGDDREHRRRRRRSSPEGAPAPRHGSHEDGACGPRARQRPGPTDSARPRRRTHRAREHRGPLRSRQLHRVRRTHDRGTASATQRLEGAAKLGYRKELAAIEDPAERKVEFERLVAHLYDVGKAVNTASYFEIDDVIDPADSRFWIARGLKSVPPPAPRESKKRPNIDTW